MRCAFHTELFTEPGFSTLGKTERRFPTPLCGGFSDAIAVVTPRPLSQLISSNRGDSPGSVSGAR